MFADKKDSVITYWMLLKVLQYMNRLVEIQIPWTSEMNDSNEPYEIDFLNDDPEISELDKWPLPIELFMI